jgi:dihydrofolate reductase
MTRKIVSAAFVSLDGVMQAPGGPDEDPSGGFAYGGWLEPLFDAKAAEAMEELLFGAPYDLLLGRKTYDIFASFWPEQVHSPDAFNRRLSKRWDELTKYVATHRPESLGWQNSRALGTDVVGDLRKLKAGDGPPLITQGSSVLIQQLLAHDLIDEIRLLYFPITLGRGKRFFGDGVQPRRFEVTASTLSTRGAMIVTYRRAGEIVTGSFVRDEKGRPSELQSRPG